MPIPMLICAAIWYLAVTSILMVGQYYLERYYGRGFEGDVSPKRGAKGRVKTTIEKSAISANTKFLDVTP